MTGVMFYVTKRDSTANNINLGDGSCTVNINGVGAQALQPFVTHTTNPGDYNLNVKRETALIDFGSTSVTSLVINWIGSECEFKISEIRVSDE